jgi:hypothetical protein
MINYIGDPRRIGGRVIDKILTRPAANIQSMAHLECLF